MKTLKILIMLLIFGLPFSLLYVTPSYATVSSNTNKVIYNGDGVSSLFSFSFKIFKSTDLVVQTYNQSTSALIKTLVLNSDYSVIINSNGTGSITLLSTNSPLASGIQLLILRSLPYTQLVQIADNSATPAQTTNEVYDRSVILSQQLYEQQSRSILQNPLNSVTLMLPSAVAGQCLGWAGDNSLANLGCSGSSGGGGGSNFNPPLSDSQLQAIVSANKVNGTALYSLASIPSGSGLIPYANLPIGTAASNLVQLNGSAQYPAIDGSQIIKVDGSHLLNLSTIPSGAGIIPIANLASGTPTGSKFVRDDGTLASAGGNFTLVSATPLSSVTNTGDIAITNTNFYKIVINIGSISGSDFLILRTNNSSVANYYSVIGNSSSATSITLSGSMSNGNSYFNGEINIYPQTNFMQFLGQVVYLDGGTSKLAISSVGGMSIVSGITSFRILSSGGATFSGTVYLYRLTTS